MSITFIAILAMGAIIGGFINGLAGTGTALFSLGFYLMVLPPTTAVAVVTLLAVLAGVPGVWVVRSEIKENKLKVLQFAV